MLYLDFFRFSDFVQVRVEITLHDDSSRFWYSTGYVFLAESKFFYDLNIDFFLFQNLAPFLIVDLWFRVLDFNNSLWTFILNQSEITLNKSNGKKTNVHKKCEHR